VSQNSGQPAAAAAAGPGAGDMEAGAIGANRQLFHQAGFLPFAGRPLRNSAPPPGLGNARFTNRKKENGKDKEDKKAKDKDRDDKEEKKAKKSKD